MRPSWFTKALHAEASRRRLSHRALARFLNRSKSSVTGWLLAERFPAFTEFCDLAERFGWDLARALPPPIRRAAEVPGEEPKECEPAAELYRADLLELIMDALESENPQVRHFALAVLEDPSFELSAKQAALLAKRLVTLSKDKRAFLSSHYILVANRLMNQTDAVIPMLGGLLVTSKNTLVRYRVLAGFLDHPEHAAQTVHFVRSALMDRTVTRAEDELACLRLADQQPAHDSLADARCRLVEGIRSSKGCASAYDLVESLDAVLNETRGEFSWYHVLDAASRCEREGPALLMGAYRALSRRPEDRDAFNRRRDIVATINRAGVEAAATCDAFLRVVMPDDPWVAFHAAAAFGKWAPKNAEIAAVLAKALHAAVPSHTEDEAQVAPMCCYAMAKVGLPSEEAAAALRKAARSNDPWLRAVARVCNEALAEGRTIQDTLVLLLEAA